MFGAREALCVLTVTILVGESYKLNNEAKAGEKAVGKIGEDVGMMRRVRAIKVEDKWGPLIWIDDGIKTETVEKREAASVMATTTTTSPTTTAATINLADVTLSDPPHWNYSTTLENSQKYTSTLRSFIQRLPLKFQRILNDKDAMGYHRWQLKRQHGDLIIDCPRNATSGEPLVGLIADTSDVSCQRFVNCDESGIGWINQCPPRLQFNVEKSICDWPRNVRCTKNSGD